MLQAFVDLEKTRNRWRNRAYYAAKVGKDHPWNLVRDWCGVVEVKLGKGGWNVHEHVLIECGPSTIQLDYGDWNTKWSEVAGPILGGHSDLQKLRGDIQAGVHYITAYLTKGAVWGGLSVHQAWQHRDVLRGRRFVRRRRGAAPRIKSGPSYERCCMPNHMGLCDTDALWGV